MTPEAEALVCARVCEAIYGTADDPVGQLTSKAAVAGLDPSQFVWIDLPGILGDLCAFVVSTREFYLLVFRGTKIPQDWLTDLRCDSARFESVFPGVPAIGEIHAGFGGCLAGEIGQIAAWMAHKDPSKPLIITGHSLGGALAAITGAYFEVKSLPAPKLSCIYTFGQPRIGLHDFCTSYSQILKGKLVRFVNQQDVVPRVPFNGLNYGDAGTMIHFDSTGTPVKESPEWRSFLARTMQGLEDFAEIVGHLKVDVGDHSMTGYRKLVEGRQAELAGLLC